MPDYDDIETRVAVLEHEVVRLRQQLILARQDAVAARILAAAADRDVAELRAQIRAHNALLPGDTGLGQN